MRFAKISRTLLPLALPVLLAAGAWAQDHPNVSPNAVRDMLTQQTAGASKPQAPAPAPASKPSAPIVNTAKAPAKAKPQTKPAAESAKIAAPAKPAAKGAAVKPAPAAPTAAKSAPEKTAKAPAEKPAEEKAPVAKRDPFDALLNKAQSNGPPENLPPGKAGLVVSSLKIDGIVNGKGGMIAIVSNPQQRTYFLREGDKLYDGSVDHITLEAISFNEVGKDAFGKPLERQVTKRLYPSPGDQQ
jgi:outer membrane biosynthesis protein TonB